MHISKRLENIATLIPANSSIIDVGCDHAFLDIYLSSEKKCHCKALDISEGALKAARRNIKKYKQEKNIEVIKTDGLKKITVLKDDYIVISGMGTSTIKHILQTNELSDNLVISTHNEFDSLRKYVTSLGYIITEELFFFDKDKPYIIIKFEKGEANYSEEDIKYGPILKKNKDYIAYLMNTLLIIKKKIPFYKFKARIYINKKIKNLKNISS